MNYYLPTTLDWGAALTVSLTGSGSFLFLRLEASSSTVSASGSSTPSAKFRFWFVDVLGSSCEADVAVLPAEVLLSPSDEDNNIVINLQAQNQILFIIYISLQVTCRTTTKKHCLKDLT